jgi:hypothetical protein
MSISYSEDNLKPGQIYNYDETGLQWKGTDMHFAYERERQTSEHIHYCNVL